MSLPLVGVGPHVLRHGDALDGIEDLMDGERASLCYTDPPWGQGLLSGFETINNRDTGASKPGHRYDDFMPRLFGLIVRNTRGWVIMEYGERWESDIRRWAAEFDLTHSGIGYAVYGGKLRRHHIHVMHTHGRIARSSQVRAFDDTSGLRTIQAARDAGFGLSGGVLLDPCCGMGYSARLALMTGMRFRGNELNAKRLGKTRAILEDANPPRSRRAPVLGRMP